MRHKIIDPEQVLDQLFEGLYILDKKRQILFWNKAAEQITGFKSDEVLGKSCRDGILNHVNSKGKNLCKTLCPVAEAIADGTSRESEIFLHHKDGHRVPVLVRVTPLRDAKGEVIGAIEIFSENQAVLKTRERLKELETLAMLDDLTQLPNRRYLNQQITLRLEEFRRTGVPFGVLVVDIDHFKKINDTYGHEGGDRVLKMVSKTLSSVKRHYDMVGRWGGEEFLALIPNVDEEQLLHLAERFRAQVEASFINIALSSVGVTISIGGSIVLPDDTEDRLFKRADEMVYKSKLMGRNMVSVG